MRVAKAVADAGAISFSALPLRLDPLVKEHCFEWLSGHYPELLRRYQKSYVQRNASSSWQQRVGEISAAARAQFGMDDRRRRGEGSSLPPRPGATQLMLI